jgi:hypothetical protein
MDYVIGAIIGRWMSFCVWLTILWEFTEGLEVVLFVHEESGKWNAEICASEETSGGLQIPIHKLKKYIPKGYDPSWGAT